MLCCEGVLVKECQKSFLLYVSGKRENVPISASRCNAEEVLSRECSIAFSFLFPCSHFCQLGCLYVARSFLNHAMVVLRYSLLLVASPL